MTLTDRERYIVLFLQGINSNDDNSIAFTKLEQYSKILNLDISDVESMQLMQELDDMMLDIIELEGHYLKINKKKLEIIEN